MTTQLSSMCYFCNNYYGNFRCRAFKTEIPREIMVGLFDHTKRFEGDKGIGFVLKRELHKANDIENLIEIYASIYPSLIKVLNQILKSFGERKPLS